MSLNFGGKQFKQTLNLTLPHLGNLWQVTCKRLFEKCTSMKEILTEKYCLYHHVRKSCRKNLFRCKFKKNNTQAKAIDKCKLWIRCWLEIIECSKLVFLLLLIQEYRAFAQGMQFVVVLEVTGNNANPPDEIPEHVLSFWLHLIISNKSCKLILFFLMHMFFLFLTGLPINATSCSFKPVIIEMIGATDLTIDCNTTDPNANVTLLLNNVRLPVWGRVTLHKQVFTIHNISTGDPRTYKCVTSSGSSMTVFCQTVITYEGVTQIEIWITLTPTSLENFKVYKCLKNLTDIWEVWV